MAGKLQYEEETRTLQAMIVLHRKDLELFKQR